MKNQQWHQYYTEKRIIHQWMQVHLLDGLQVEHVLEIGPYLGLVTAMLRNAGYGVTTLDVVEGDGLVGDVRDLDVEDIAKHNFDLVLCCETLEHLPFADVDAVLNRISTTGIRYLILSVPFSGNQLGFSLYLNRHSFKKRSFLKKFMGSKPFPRPPPGAGPEYHHWEVGYQDTPLSKWRHQVEKYNRILRTDFTDGCRSVFFVCENKKHSLNPD